MTVQQGSQADPQDHEEIRRATPGTNDAGQRVEGRQKGTTKYLNEDLPGYPETLRKFRDHVLPRWYYYVSRIDNPWDLYHPDHVTFGQMLWDSYVKLDHTLALRNEPVFALVSWDNCISSDPC